MYNNFNQKKRKHKVLKEDINPLIEKDIIKVTTPTKHHIADGIQNKRIVLNRDILDVDEDKIKVLKLSHYINKNQD
jgi:hypothetical protein